MTDLLMKYLPLEECSALLQENPALDKTDIYKAQRLVEFLESCECTSKQIKIILTTNLYFFTNNIEELQELKYMFERFGLTSLNYLFESNPEILNVSPDYILNKIEKDLKNHSLDEIIDRLETDLDYLI